MQYKSPITALTPFLHKSEKLETIDLNSLKKRILAEFELSGNSAIKTKSGEYSKNEIIKIIDDIKSANDFKFHVIISNHPQLLNLLENYRITEPFSFETPVFKDQDFIEFISPYVAFALGRYYASYLNDSKRYMTYTIQKNIPVLPKDQHLMTDPVYEIFDTISKKIEKVSSLIGKSKELVDARVYFTNNRIRVINHLPKKYFEKAVEVYAIEGFNLLVSHLKNRDKMLWYEPVAKEVYHQLKKLHGNDKIFQEIKKLNSYFEPIESENQDLEENNGCATTVRIIGGVIVLISLLMRLASC